VASASPRLPVDLRCRHPKSRDYAVDLGIALQLTNILRDLKADALRGRIYIPADEIEAFGYGEADLLAGVRSDAYLALMQHSRAGPPPLRQRSRGAAGAGPAAPPGGGVMGAIYRRLLQRIESDRFRVFERRITCPA